MIAITPRERDFIEKVFRVFLPKGTVVCCFGSRVSGGHRQYSDLDIAIKAKEELGEGVIENMQAVFEGSDLVFRVDLSDYSRLSDDFREIIDATCEVWEV